ncbi:MAG: phasin family protein [Syntrophales bacterium]|nr:phasin family protein [Syntrophales bacterium]
MDSLLKKALLTGMGLALLAADKLKETAEELTCRGGRWEKEGQEILKRFLAQTERTGETLRSKQEEILTEIFAFWYYGVITDEVEDKMEALVVKALERLDIPTRKEMEEIRARIAALEKEQG